MLDAHHDRVLAYVRRRLPPSETDDAVAETFATAWRNLDRLEGDPLLWLYGIARRTVFSHRRSTARGTRLVGRVQTHWVSGVVPDHAEAIGWEEPFETALSSLREGEREVLRLIAWEDLTGPEAAAVLGCSVAAFKVRLHRARRRMRALLDADAAVAPSNARRKRRPESRGGPHSLLSEEIS